jgi:hypothetical protein
MTQGFRWLLAAAVTLAAFCFVLCLSVALVLPTWVRSATDRWVVGVGVAGAAAAVAALWGASFAGGEAPEASAPSAPVPSAAPAGFRPPVAEPAAPRPNVWMNASASGGSITQVAGDQINTGLPRTGR